ncbi:MAG TPA: hypothetical protein DCX07_02950, partial [Phycisphaerales bacterium]|nr:hypothetical protein [Phycisphaerales bacterium]
MLACACGARGQATSQPDPASASAPAIAESVPTLQRVDEALQFTPEQQVILDDLRANRHSPSAERAQPPARKDFPLLMSKVAQMPDLSPADWAGLDQPAHRNLVREPERYFARPVRTNVIVFAFRRLEVNDGLVPSRHWSKDRPVWRLQCLNADAERPVLEPLEVYTTCDPASVLGRADFSSGDKEQNFNLPGRQARVAGVFYGNYRARDRGGKDRPPVERTYPVLLAWQMEKVTQTLPPGETNWLTRAIPLALALLLAGFVLLKRMTRRRRPDKAPEDAYRPQRFESQAPPEAT